MSFISILKKIGTVALGVEHVAAPILSAAVPGLAPGIAVLDGIFQRVQTGIVTVEANNPVDGQGALKSQAIIGDFNAGLEITQQILAAKGETLQYDNAALQDGINHQVAAYNAWAKVKASFKIVPLTPSPAQPPIATEAKQ